MKLRPSKKGPIQHKQLQTHKSIASLAGCQTKGHSFTTKFHEGDLQSQLLRLSQRYPCGTTWTQ